jgi:hypothetical protein
MCTDGWYLGKADGECEDCGEPTVDGHAQSGCHWSGVVCETCGAAPCDESC